jgi:hypothetical protein
VKFFNVNEKGRKNYPLWSNSWEEKNWMEPNDYLKYFEIRLGSKRRSKVKFECAHFPQTYTIISNCFILQKEWERIDKKVRGMILSIPQG